MDHSGNQIGPVWEKVASAEFAVNRFTVTSLQGSCQIVVGTTFGGVRAATYRPGSPSTWLPIDLRNIPPVPGSPPAAPTSAKAKFFITGADGKIYSIDWESAVD